MKKLSIQPQFLQAETAPVNPEKQEDLPTDEHHAALDEAHDFLLENLFLIFMIQT